MVSRVSRGDTNETAPDNQQYWYTYRELGITAALHQNLGTSFQKPSDSRNQTWIIGYSNASSGIRVEGIRLH